MAGQITKLSQLIFKPYLATPLLFSTNHKFPTNHFFFSFLCYPRPPFGLNFPWDAKILSYHFSPMGSCYSSFGGHARSSNLNSLSLSHNGDHDNCHRAPIKPPEPIPVINILSDPSGREICERYTLGKELGRGEFGITYECTDVKTGETFACKSISKNKLRTDTDIEDVKREVQIMRHLPKHPNIVSFREVYEDNENVHLVMELCKGGELFDRIVSRGHYTERAAATVTKTIIEVIKLCHEQGVMHRDLKPENFLFSDKDEAATLKAIDFGLSVFFKPDERFSEIVGSPYYMAPEVLRRNYGPEVDIWSAGVILYILLCGVPPFWAETDEGIAQAVVKSVIDFEREPWPKISDSAKDLVKGMLDPNFYTRLKAQEVLEHPWLLNANTVSNVNLGNTVKARLKQFSLVNKFKKRALRVVAKNLPIEQLIGIKRMCQTMNPDHSGKLSVDQRPSQEFILGKADLDKSGVLNSCELVTVSFHLMKRVGSEEHLCKAFNYFDKNESGFIEFDELKEALLDDNLGADNEKVIRAILFDVDTDQDGRVSYEEFKAMMKSGTDWRMGSRQYSRAMLNTLSKRMFKEPSVQQGR